MADDFIPSNPTNAYVYAIIVDGVVRYIGKGIGNRVAHHVRKARALARRRASGERIRTTRFYSRLIKALARGAVIEGRILQDGLSESDAFARERAEIAAVGFSQLWNTNEGGIGPTSNDLRRLFTCPEHRAKHKASLNTPEAIARRSAATASQWADPAVRARKIEGLTQSWQGNNERRDAARAKTTTRFSTEEARNEHRERMRIASSSAEVRARKSIAAQKLAADPAHGAKISAALKVAWKKPGALERKSAASKAGWADPVVRARRSAAVKAARSTPESRAKTRAQMEVRRVKKRAESV